MLMVGPGVRLLVKTVPDGQFEAEPGAPSDGDQAPEADDPVKEDGGQRRSGAGAVGDQ
jgi:hypothetical protein